MQASKPQPFPTTLTPQPASWLSQVCTSCWQMLRGQRYSAWLCLFQHTLLTTGRCQSSMLCAAAPALPAAHRQPLQGILVMLARLPASACGREWTACLQM
jgi:hypothetical protein